MDRLRELNTNGSTICMVTHDSCCPRRVAWQERSACGSFAS